jgi:glyoxylase-like metal-dependent hydrolase (beta-lactamase superfamily II)
MTSERPQVVIDELTPRIHVIRGTGLSAHVFVLRGRDLSAVIDTGSRERSAFLVEGLPVLGLRPADIGLVLNTHEHFDHVGGNAVFPSSTLIAAHHHAARKLLAGDRFVTMVDEPETTRRVSLLLRDGAEIDLGGLLLRVVYTPGHTSGSTCFLEPREGLLFTGDTLFAGGVLSYIAESGSVGDYLASVEQLASLRIARFFPAHGRPSSDSQGDVARAAAAARALLDGEDVPVRRRGSACEELGVVSRASVFPDS